MDPATAARLQELDRRFYEQVGPAFSRSRARLNPGIVRGLRGLGSCGTLLDVGCGDGRVGLAWRAGELPIAWAEGSRYVGVDRSAALLGARAPWPEGLVAVRADLGVDPWPEGPFDVVCCLAVLHHVPGRAARRALLERIAGSLGPGGSWLISVWQVLHQDRFRRRLVPWSEVGIDPGTVDPGDVLLDWRLGRRAIRYVHHYDAAELAADCAAAGLGEGDAFRSDGRTGDLGLYRRGRRPEV